MRIDLSDDIFSAGLAWRRNRKRLAELSTTDIA